MSDSIEKRFNDIIDSIKRKLEATAEKVEEYLDKGDVNRAYRVWKDSVLDSLRTLRRALDSIGEELKSAKVSEEELHRLANSIRDGVREVIYRIEDIGSRIKDLRGRKLFIAMFGPRHLRHIFHDIVGGVEITIDRVLDGVERLVADIEKSLEDIGKRVTQVVSVRIREQDLEVVDRLVEAGIFKSRSEAIAYFARRGIESSREWIEKALEQAKRIKELQEAVRKELGHEDEESDEE